MSVYGIFVYTPYEDKTAGFGTGIISESENGNGFVEKTNVAGVVKIPEYMNGYRIIKILSYSIRCCALITKLILPCSLTSLEYGSITVLPGLTELFFPASIIVIGDCIDVFANAERVFFEKGSRVTQIGAWFLRISPKLKEFSIPPFVEIIGKGLFQGNTGLKKLSYCGTTDFSSITQSFEQCSELKSVFVSHEYSGSVFGIKSVTIVSFNQCDHGPILCRTKVCHSKSVNSFLVVFVFLLCV